MSFLISTSSIDYTYLPRYLDTYQLNCLLLKEGLLPAELNKDIFSSCSPQLLRSYKCVGTYCGMRNCHLLTSLQAADLYVPANFDGPDQSNRLSAHIFFATT